MYTIYAAAFHDDMSVTMGRAVRFYWSRQEAEAFLEDKGPGGDIQEIKDPCVDMMRMTQGTPPAELTGFLSAFKYKQPSYARN